MSVADLQSFTVLSAADVTSDALSGLQLAAICGNES